MDLLLPYLGDLLTCRAFARRVACALEVDDFIKTNHRMDGGPWDEYGVSLADGIATEFGLDNARTWYLKLKVVRQDEEELYFLSFHRPEAPLKRIGGTLGP